MTAVLPIRITRAPAEPASPSRVGMRVRLPWRLIRRGTLFIWLTAVVYMAIEILSFRNTYPDEASRQKLLELSSSSVVRMMQGDPGAVSTAGGFAVWDGGWMLMVIVGTWALLTAARLTRGEEDSGRAELVLSRPVTARQDLGASLGAMGVAAIGLAVTAPLPFVLLGEPVGGAMLWGAGLALYCCVFAALGALVAQVFEPRRRVVSVGLGLVAAAYLLRVVANSEAERTWLLTLTPFGWVDRLRIYAEDRWWWLAAPLVAALVLSAAALALRVRRDAGAALLRSREARRSRVRLLGSATRFGWRITSGALVAWALTLAVSGVVFGLMTQAIVDFIEEDETYRKMLESLGMDMSMPVVGFLSYMGLFLALTYAAFTGWRLGALRTEEAEGRLENLLVRGVVRWRWLAVTTIQAFLAAVLLVVASTLGLWAGILLVDAPVTARQLLEPMVGTLPLVALFTGIAVLGFGIAPRLTVIVPVTLAVLAYMLDTFGAMLSWPEAVLAISPFHHLARLPSDPMSVTAVIGLSGAGLVLSVAGIVAFSRRDLHGA